MARILRQAGYVCSYWSDDCSLLEPVDVTHVYAVDEDADGVVDSYLFLEEPDTLG